MNAATIDLDVRPILRNGGEPFGQIMATVMALRPGQSLRLFATFQPVPLFHVLGSKGYAHSERQLPGGDWEVLFTPAGTAAPGPAAPAPVAAASAGDGAWPAPSVRADHRDLDPPEPMMRILAGLEAMQPGQVMSAVLCREPLFLLPELDQRGHRWQGAFDTDGRSYTILIQVGGGTGANA